MDAHRRLILINQASDPAGAGFVCQQYCNVFQIYEIQIEEYDGMSIQPAPTEFGLDFNRNFPVGWQPQAKQSGAGKYPLRNIETRVFAEFVTSHKNICNAINFHTFEGLFLYPPGMKAKKDALGLNSGMKGSGSLEDFMHFGCGIFTYTVETWDLAQRCGMKMEFPDPFGFGDDPSPSAEDEATEFNARCLLKWVEDNKLESYYMPWTPFDHPQLGRVEIGGADPKYLRQNPPIKFLLEELQKNTGFIVRHAKTMPHVKLVRQWLNFYFSSKRTG